MLEREKRRNIVERINLLRVRVKVTDNSSNPVSSLEDK